MDPRIREHAKIISMHSTSIEKGDNVVIDANPVADDLVTALCEICAEIGANPLVIRERTGTRFLRAYLNRSKGEFQIPTHEMALFKEMDVYIAIRGGGNDSEMSDVDQKKMNDYNLVKKPIRDERLSKRWCLTQFPAPENAQRASMSTEEYENFEIAHFRLLGDSNYLPYGKAMVEGGRKTWKQLSLMEDAMLIHRIMRAPEKRIFKVDIGNIPPAEVDNYMNQIIDKMKEEFVRFKDTVSHQLSTLGGGGSVNILDNDDVDLSAQANGKVLAYNSTTKKMAFVDNAGGGINLGAIDEHLALQIISGMKSKIAGQVLSQLDVKVAKALTEKLAGKIEDSSKP